jgi:galactokinase/mevalonate kinase-like predicted kinase
MAYILKAPARINLLGNPSDANEGDFATISTAVDLFAHAIITKAPGIVLEQVESTAPGQETRHQETYSQEVIPLPYTRKLDLVKGAVNRLYEYSPQFRQAIRSHGFKISTWTDVPRQSGLGGSSLFPILTLGGLRALYNLDPYRHNEYVLAELTQRVEAKELGITAGYADRYVPIFGGIAYLDYRGKLHQKSLHEEPYTTYERLDAWVEEVPLVAVSSGVVRDSGDVHGQMRPRYLEEFNTWVERGGPAPLMVQFMRQAWETAWRGKIALMCRDWATFGVLMNKNHQVVNDMMEYCGFEDGAGWANNLLVEAALTSGALGAKLTGAGGGGSVFAITQPGKESVLVDAWQNATQAAGLDQARIFLPQITRQGLTVERT